MHEQQLYRAGLKANIWKLQLYLGLYSLMFFIPIITLFFLDNGLSLTQIMIIQGAYSILYVVLEIPSGYFADAFGRKTALLITGICTVLSVFLFASGTGFFQFLLANICWATAGVFISGADTALLYDSLKELQREKEYKKIWGNITFIYLMGAALASILGGLLGEMGLRYPFYAMLPSALLLIAISLSFSEPKREQKIVKKHFFSQMMQEAKLSFLDHKQRRWLLLYGGIITSFLGTAYFLYQPYFVLSGIDIAYFGLVFASFYALSGISARYAHLFEDRWGQKISLLLLLLVPALGFFLMGHVLFFWGFLFALLFQFAKGFSSVVLSDALHQMSSSKNRATVFSLQSVLEKIFLSLLAPSIGWIADVYTLPQALKLSGVLLLLFGGIALLLLWKHTTKVL